MAGLNEEVTISFLLVGHTKFAPDQGFGLFKRVFKRTTVGTIHDIADVVQKSAVLNHPQLIGIMMVPHLSNFTTGAALLKNIPLPSRVSANTNIAACPAVTLGLFLLKLPAMGRKDHSWKASRSTMPPLVIPAGLPLECQWYLYNKILEFCHIREKHHCRCPRRSTQKCKILSSVTHYNTASATPILLYSTNPTPTTLWYYKNNNSLLTCIISIIITV